MKLWQGNVFTPVCQSFCVAGGRGHRWPLGGERVVCGRGGGKYMAGGDAWPVDIHGWGCAWPGGVCMAMGSAW